MPESDNRLTERVQAAIRAALPGAGVTRLLVACSGGGDSVCLAHATAAVAARERWSLALGHVRHGVRADDDRDAAAVTALGRSLGVPVLIHVHRPAAGATDEAALRHARYTALGAMAIGHGAEAVLTGHTRDDQAETVLLRLMRGAGVDGLGGIDPDAPFPVPIAAPLRVVRPLLAVARADTRAYCAAHALAYCEDPTNADGHYARNWMRHTLLPLLVGRYPAAVPTVARTAAVVREDAALLQTLAREALARCTESDDGAIVAVLSRERFTREPVALQRRILRLLLHAYGERDPRADRVEVVRRAVVGTSTSVRTVGNVAFWPANGFVTVGPPGAVTMAVRRRALRAHPLQRFQTPVYVRHIHTFPADAAAPDARYRLVVAPWRVGDPALPGDDADNGPVGSVLLRLPPDAAFTLRNRLPGDRFHPVGASGSRKLQDYFTEMAVPADLRDEVVLLVAGDDIIAVIGYDVSASCIAWAGDATHILTVEATHEGGIDR